MTPEERWSAVREALRTRRMRYHAPPHSIVAQRWQAEDPAGYWTTVSQATAAMASALIESGEFELYDTGTSRTRYARPVARRGPREEVTREQLVRVAQEVATGFLRLAGGSWERYSISDLRWHPVRPDDPRFETLRAVQALFV